MICGNCGFQNQPGDEFCGSCGQFLAWTGAPADAGQAGAGNAASAAVPGPSSPTVAPPPPAAPLPAAPPDAPTTVLPVPGPPPTTAPPATQASPTAPTSGSGAYWPAGIVRCNVCGTANELTRTFCLNCGSKLPKAGTTGGMAVAGDGAGSGRSFRAALYALGAALIFLVAVAIAFVGLGGLNGPRPAANTPTPGPTLAALASASAALPTLPSSPGASTLPPASFPAQTPAVTETPPATPPATAPPPATPQPSAPVGMTCSDLHLEAVNQGNWRINTTVASHQGPADSLTLNLGAPTASSTNAAVDATLVPPDQVMTQFGVPGPTAGDIALVLAFNDAVTAAKIDQDVGFRALSDYHVIRNAGTVYVVIGINGSGCYAISSDGWASGADQPTTMVIQIAR